LYNSESKQARSVVVVKEASQMLANQAAATARMWQATLSATSVKKDARMTAGTS